MRRRLIKGIEVQARKASQLLKSCGIKEEVLHEEWASQRASELSIQACKSA